MGSKPSAYALTKRTKKSGRDMPTSNVSKLNSSLTNSPCFIFPYYKYH